MGFVNCWSALLSVFLRSVGEADVDALTGTFCCARLRAARAVLPSGADSLELPAESRGSARELFCRLPRPGLPPYLTWSIAQSLNCWARRSRAGPRLLRRTSPVPPRGPGGLRWPWAARPELRPSTAGACVPQPSRGAAPAGRAADPLLSPWVPARPGSTAAGTLAVPRGRPRRRAGLRPVRHPPVDGAAWRARWGDTLAFSGRPGPCASSRASGGQRPLPASRTRFLRLCRLTGWPDPADVRGGNLRVWLYRWDCFSRRR